MDRSPLVVRCGAMGDMVMILALTDALHRRFGQPVDVLSSGGWSRPLLEGQPSVGRVYVVGSRRAPFLFSGVQREVVADLRERGPQPSWLCDRGIWAKTLLHRAGFGDDWLTTAGRDCPLQPDEHHVDRWIRFASASPAVVASLRSAPLPEATGTGRWPAPPLHILPAWSVDLDAWLREKGLAERPLFLVQAGNKRTMRWWAPQRRDTNTKYWPEDRWAAVIRTMLEDDAEARVVLLGVPAEAPLNEAIARQVGSTRVFNVAHELPIGRLLALQQRAQAMVSVDTGPAHSAAALDCPLVVLFGEAEVARYAPRSPSGRVQVVEGRAGHGPKMQRITVADVQLAWRNLRTHRSTRRLAEPAW